MGESIRNRVFVNNDLPEKVVDRIISEYGLYDLDSKLERLSI